MDMRQSWCLGFSVAITLAAIGSIATLTDASFEAASAVDMEADGLLSPAGSDTSPFDPVIDLPNELQAGATTNLTLGLVGVDSQTPAGSLPMIQIHLELELVPAARGWVGIPRDRHLLAPEDLHRRSFALRVAAAAPCGIIPGRLTVTVSDADGSAHGTSSQIRRLLPPIACDQLPPTAPPSLHAPAGSCAEFDDDRPLAAAVVEPPGCNEPLRPRTPRARPTTPADDETDERDPSDDETDERDPSDDDSNRDGDPADPADEDGVDGGTEQSPEGGDPAPDEPQTEDPGGGTAQTGDPTEDGGGAGADDGGGARSDRTTTSGSDAVVGDEDAADRVRNRH